MSHDVMGPSEWLWLARGHGKKKRPRTRGVHNFDAGEAAEQQRLADDGEGARDDGLPRTTHSASAVIFHPSQCDSMLRCLAGNCQASALGLREPPDGACEAQCEGSVH